MLKCSVTPACPHPQPPSGLWINPKQVTFPRSRLVPSHIEEVRLPLTEPIWHLLYSGYNTFIYASQDTLLFQRLWPIIDPF